MQTESIPGTHTISQTNRLPESETHILSPSALSSVAVSAHALTPAQIHMQALFSQSMPHSKSVTITEPKQAPVVTLLPISADGNSNSNAEYDDGLLHGPIINIADDDESLRVHAPKRAASRKSMKPTFHECIVYFNNQWRYLKQKYPERVSFTAGEWRAYDKVPLSVLLPSDRE